MTYPKEFSGNKREVTLLPGQAFFSVHPDKVHPLVVKTKNMDVKALGTAFEVFSFDGDKSVETGIA
ncbi:FecR domain-containing protein [Bacteroides fragilis]|nr:FecR domain-containing protein [Bacteroides fragilis]